MFQLVVTVSAIAGFALRLYGWYSDGTLQPSLPDRTPRDRFNGNLAAQKFSGTHSPVTLSLGESAPERSARTMCRTGRARFSLARRPTASSRWTYDSQSTPEALSRPALKNRGVAHWESAADGPCEQRVPVGTVDAKRHAVDADIGALCEEFGEDCILDVNQWNETNDISPFSLLQPPTVVCDRIPFGWSRKARAYSVEPPGNLMAIDTRTANLLWETGFIPTEMASGTGTANISSPMSADPELGFA